MNIDKDDIEWLISLVVTIWLGLRKKPKTKKEPKKSKHRKSK